MSTVTAVPLQPTKRRVLVWIWGAVILAVLAAIALAAQAPGDPSASLLAKNKRDKGVIETPSGLQYKILEPGSGPTPTDNDVTLIQYEGKYPDGTTFDKSQQPTPLSPKGVVPGFGEGLKLMPKGAKYRFWIKPSLGYGAPRPAGAPPPSSPEEIKLAQNVLIFDVEMVDFRSEEWIRQQQQMMQQQGGMPGGAPGAEGAPHGEAAPSAAPQGR